MKKPEKVMNCIVVFNREKDKVLFCKRKKEPFKGRLNFVGGKVEPGETSEAAAYRGNLRRRKPASAVQHICLYRLMDLTLLPSGFHPGDLSAGWTERRQAARGDRPSPQTAAQ